jgi:NAD(P)-dependent dehydrogenase (short-subunit alcohol dehydrogenase family)
MDMRLGLKNILITGAASGIGLATAVRCLQEGARVALADVPTSAGAERVADLALMYPGRCIFVPVDVRSSAEVNKMVDRTVQTFGRLDGVFNNAGVGDMDAADHYSDEAFERVLDIDLVGVFRVARAALRQMYAQGQGHYSILNCASILGLLGQSQTAAYSAAKGGVVNLTHTLALEAASHGVRVNAICPGYIETPMLAGFDEAQRQFLVSLHPLGRLGKPEEIAHVAVFLLSDEAAFVTGAHWLVDGGFSAGKS